MPADTRERESSWFTDLLLGQESDYPAVPSNAAGTPSRFSVAIAFIALAAVGLALAGVAAGFSTTKPALQATRDQLAARVQAMSDRVDDWNAANAELAAANAGLVDLVLPDLDGLLATEVKRARGLGGYEPLGGAGAVIKIENVGVNRDPTEWALDTDLQVAVNGLFAAGAKGVSVNGLRITSSSSIRGAGGNILVDYQPVTSPYRIAAVGKDLLRRFSKLPAKAWLNDLATNYPVDVWYVNRKHLTLPAGTIPTVTYAERINP